MTNNPGPDEATAERAELERLLDTTTAMTWRCSACGRPWDIRANFCGATEDCEGQPHGIGVMARTGSAVSVEITPGGPPAAHAQLRRQDEGLAALRAEVATLRENAVAGGEALRAMARRSVTHRRWFAESSRNYHDAVGFSLQLQAEAREAAKSYSITCGNLVRERDALRAELSALRDGRVPGAEGQLCTSCDHPLDRCEAYSARYGFSCALPSGHRWPHHDNSGGGYWDTSGQLGPLPRNGSRIVQAEDLSSPVDDARPSIPLDALRALAQGEPLDEVAGDYGVPLDVAKAAAPFVGRKAPVARPVYEGEGDEEVWIPPGTDCMDFGAPPCPHCGERCLHHRTNRCGLCGRRPTVPSAQVDVDRHPRDEACIHCATPDRLASSDPVIDCPVSECPNVGAGTPCWCGKQRLLGAKSVEIAGQLHAGHVCRKVQTRDRGYVGKFNCTEELHISGGNCPHCVPFAAPPVEEVAEKGEREEDGPDWIVDLRRAMHPFLASVQENFCSMCGDPAAHKVAEQHDLVCHELSNYLCCLHFKVSVGDCERYPYALLANSVEVDYAPPDPPVSASLDPREEAAKRLWAVQKLLIDGHEGWNAQRILIVADWLEGKDSDLANAVARALLGGADRG